MISFYKVVGQTYLNNNKHWVIQNYPKFKSNPITYIICAAQHLDLTFQCRIFQHHLNFVKNFDLVNETKRAQPHTCM